MQSPNKTTPLSCSRNTIFICYTCIVEKFPLYMDNMDRNNSLRISILHIVYLHVMFAHALFMISWMKSFNILMFK